MLYFEPMYVDSLKQQVDVTSMLILFATFLVDKQTRHSIDKSASLD